MPRFKASGWTDDTQQDAVPTGSRHADASALEALVDAAAGILPADSLSDTLGRIAHHVGELLDFDELSVYEVDRAAEMLVPVFALGEYAAEVMADSFPVGEGVTGWVVANRRTRNVERADEDPIAAIVEGTEMEAESFASVPLLVADRVVAALNVYDLSDYPATEYVLRTRTAGQVVAGDPASDPSEVALLERSGFQAVLLVPLVFGGRDVGLLELYRRHAIPWNSGEIERAQLLAHQLGAVIDHLAAAPHDRAAR